MLDFSHFNESSLSPGKKKKKKEKRKKRERERERETTKSTFREV